MKTRVCVVGLGYVGLPLASLASTQYEVIGLDIDFKKVQSINAKICPLHDDPHTMQVFEDSDFGATTSVDILDNANIIVVCVPTPIDDKHYPDLNPLKAAAKSIAQHLQKGQLIIIESTIYPGTTQEVIIPILEESGLTAGKDFGIAYCPERIDPGNRTWNLGNIARVLAGLTSKDAQRAQDFYSSFIDAPITILSSLKSAEAVKILENTFRDVNIAFINEMAQSFDSLGIDLQEVIRGASTKPFGFMPFYPGPGVGGHCIPVDPYYLIERAKASGFDHQFLHLARKINLSMPEYVVHILQDELNTLGVSISKSKIGIMGVAYKSNVGDIRESPALKVIEILKKKNASLEIYDPYVTSISTVGSVTELLLEVDYVVLLTNHSEFMDLDVQEYKKNNIQCIIDTRNSLDKQKMKEFGIAFRGIGRNGI